MNVNRSTLNLQYFRVPPGGKLPDLSVFNPFWVVLIIEEEVTPQWRDEVSAWLVGSGCRYMMAWGLDCASWDETVDHANLQQFGYGEIPEKDFVFTTWHENDSLEEVFFFAKYAARHPAHELKNLVLVHIAYEKRADEFEEMFATV